MYSMFLFLGEHISMVIITFSSPPLILPHHSSKISYRSWNSLINHIKIFYIHTNCLQKIEIQIIYLFLLQNSFINCICIIILWAMVPSSKYKTCIFKYVSALFIVFAFLRCLRV